MSSEPEPKRDMANRCLLYNDMMTNRWLTLLGEMANRRLLFNHMMANRLFALLGDMTNRCLLYNDMMTLCLSIENILLLAATARIATPPSAPLLSQRAALRSGAEQNQCPSDISIFEIF